MRPTLEIIAWQTHRQIWCFEPQAFKRRDKIYGWKVYDTKVIYKPVPASEMLTLTYDMSDAQGWDSITVYEISLAVAVIIVM